MFLCDFHIIVLTMSIDSYKHLIWFSYDFNMFLLIIHFFHNLLTLFIAFSWIPLWSYYDCNANLLTCSFAIILWMLYLCTCHVYIDITIIMLYNFINIVLALANASTKYVSEMYNKFLTCVHNIYKIVITDAY